MPRGSLFLTLADIRLMFRAKELMLWAFVMPVIFFYFIGTITGGSGSGDERDRLAVHMPADAGFLADQLIERLKAADYSVIRVGDPSQLDRYRRQLRVPARFTQSVSEGRQSVLRLSRKSEGLGGDYDDFRINRAAYTLLADVIVMGQHGMAVSHESFVEFAKRPRMLTLKHETAGTKREIPTGFQQSVPGTMVFLVLLVLVTGGSALVIERQNGLLRRLASSPMSRGEVVLGKWGSRVLFSSIQIAFAMIVGAAGFGIQWGPHYFAVAAIMLAYVALAASLGMLLGNFCTTQGQAIAIGVIASNVLACLGGCWWPIEITPAWCQKLAMFLPTGWVMDALHQLLSFGAEPSVVMPHLAALVVSAAIAGWLVARQFRFM